MDSRRNVSGSRNKLVDEVLQVVDQLRLVGDELPQLERLKLDGALEST